MPKGSGAEAWTFLTGMTTLTIWDADIAWAAVVEVARSMPMRDGGEGIAFGHA